MSKTEASKQPSDLELQILGVLWQHGPSTVRQIMEKLSDEKERGYTAVLSVVQSMQRKKLVVAKQVGKERAYRYTARKTRQSILGPILGGLVQRVFAGDPAAAVEQLLDASDLQPETIQRLRDVIANAESQSNTDQSSESGDAS